MANKKPRSSKKKRPSKPENSHTGSKDASKVTIDGDDPQKTKKSKKKKPSEEPKNTDKSGKPSAMKYKDQQLEISTNPNDDAEVSQEENEIEGTGSPEVRRKASTTSSTDQANSDFFPENSERNKKFEDDMNNPGTPIEPDTSENISDINVNIVEQESLIDKQIEKPPDPNDIIVTGKIDNNGNTNIFLHEDLPKNSAPDAYILETEHEILHETYKNRFKEIRDAKTPSETETVIDSIRDTTTAEASDVHMPVGKETAVGSSLIENSTGLNLNESQPIDDETNESTISKNSSEDLADTGETKLNSFSEASVDNAIKESSTALVVGTKPRRSVITDDPVSILKTDVLRKKGPKNIEALSEDKLRRTTKPKESVSNNNINRIPDIVEIEKDLRSEKSINNVRAVIAADTRGPTADINYNDNIMDEENEVASVVKESTDNVSAQKIIELFENGAMANVETTPDIVEDSPDIVNERNSVITDNKDEAKSNEVEREKEIWNGGKNTDTMENGQNAVQDEQDAFAHREDVPGSTDPNVKKELPVVVEIPDVVEHNNDTSEDNENSTKTAEAEESTETVAVDENLKIEDDVPDTTADDKNASKDNDNVARNAGLDESAETVAANVSPDVGEETITAAGNDISGIAYTEIKEIIPEDDDSPDAVEEKKNESKDIDDVEDNAGNPAVEKYPDEMYEERVVAEDSKNESKDDDDGDDDIEESAEKAAVDEKSIPTGEAENIGTEQTDRSAGTPEVYETSDAVVEVPVVSEDSKNETKDDEDIPGTAEAGESAQSPVVKESPDAVEENKNESKDNDNVKDNAGIPAVEKTPNAVVDEPVAGEGGKKNDVKGNVEEDERNVKEDENTDKVAADESPEAEVDEPVAE
ncbi:hypothetical protein GcM1_201002, partial [Golovinomyces cichoracearum]